MIVIHPTDPYHRAVSLGDVHTPHSLHVQEGKIER